MDTRCLDLNSVECAKLYFYVRGSCFRNIVLLLRLKFDLCDFLLLCSELAMHLHTHERKWFKQKEYFPVEQMCYKSTNNLFSIFPSLS